MNKNHLTIMYKMTGKTCNTLRKHNRHDRLSQSSNDEILPHVCLVIIDMKTNTFRVGNKAVSVQFTFTIVSRFLKAQEYINRWLIMKLSSIK